MGDDEGHHHAFVTFFTNVSPTCAMKDKVFTISSATVGTVVGFELSSVKTDSTIGDPIRLSVQSPLTESGNSTLNWTPDIA